MKINDSLMRRRLLKAVLYYPCALLLASCSQQTINSANNDANHDAAAVHQAVSNAAQQAKPKLDAAGLGLRVTTAIAANQNLPHNSIRVDATSTGVRLRGTVKTEQQKQLAGRVATDTLGANKSVDNELTVAGQ